MSQVEQNQISDILASLEAMVEKNNNTAKDNDNDNPYVTVGLSQGLLQSAYDNKNEKATGVNIGCHFVATNATLKVADGHLSPEQSKEAVSRLSQKAVKEGKGVMKARIRFSTDQVEDLLGLFEDEEAHYLQLVLSILGPIEGRKVQTDDGRTLPSIRCGVALEVLDYLKANNPMPDKSELATLDELESLVVEDAKREREKFNSWQQAKNIGSFSRQQTEEEILEEEEEEEGVESELV